MNKDENGTISTRLKSHAIIEINKHINGCGFSVRFSNFILHRNYNDYALWYTGWLATDGLVSPCSISVKSLTAHLPLPNRATGEVVSNVEDVRVNCLFTC